MQIITQDIDFTNTGFDDFPDDLPWDVEFTGEPPPRAGKGRFPTGFNLTHPPPPDGKDYEAVIRRFDNGQVEVTTHRIDALRRLEFARISHLRACSEAPLLRYKTEEDISQLSQAEIDAKIADSKARAVRRARQKVRWLVKSMQADHLLTLNYRENMTDIERLKKDFKNFVQSVRTKYPDWQYVCIHEKQERGAYHLHLAVRGRQDVKYLRRCWYKALGAPVDATGTDVPGQIDVRAPWKKWGGKGFTWKPDRLSGYLCKYLAKAFDESGKGAKRYWHTKGIQLPEPERVWLGATNFVDAIVETHGLVMGCGVPVNGMWASDDYASIWMTG